MQRVSAKPVDAEVVAFWRTRLSALRRRLSETPEAGDAWFWEVQCQIIQFLLRRHGGEEIQGPTEVLEEIAAAEWPPVPGPVPLEVRPSGSFGGSGDLGKSPRVSSQIRKTLATIVEANQERHRELQRLREEMIAAMRGKQHDSFTKIVAGVQAALDDDSPDALHVFSDQGIGELFYKLLVMDRPTQGSADSERGPRGDSGDTNLEK
jgi:hypothetical protein